MSTPSLADFNKKPAPTPKPVKTDRKTDMKHITVRMPHARHRRILALTMDREIKIQVYIMGLIEADFKRLGLPID